MCSLLGALVFVGVGAAKSSKQSATPFVACLVTDIGGLNDRGFNHLAYVGLLAAHAKLHATTYVLQSKSPNDYIPNFSTCVSKYKANLIIGVGFLMEGDIQTMAKKYPSTKWAGVDMNAKTDFKGGITTNFEGLIFAENEVGYEAGYIAALMAQNDHHTTVQLRRRHPCPGGRALHRGLPGRRQEGRAEHPGAERLLAGLRRSGQVQEHRARPDLEGL